MGSGRFKIIVSDHDDLAVRLDEYGAAELIASEVAGYFAIPIETTVERAIAIETRERKIIIEYKSASVALTR